MEVYLWGGVNFAKEYFEQKVSCNHCVTAFARPNLVWVWVPLGVPEGALARLPHALHGQVRAPNQAEAVPQGPALHQLEVQPVIAHSAHPSN